MDYLELMALPLADKNAIWKIAKNDGRGRPFVDPIKAAKYIWFTAHRNPQTVAEWYRLAKGGKPAPTPASASLDNLLGGNVTPATIDNPPQSAFTQEEPAAMAQSPAVPQDVAGQLAAAIAAVLAAQKTAVDPEQVRVIAREEIEAAKLPQIVTHQVTITRPDGTQSIVTGEHKLFAKLLKLCALRVNVWLPGPAGAGKSHLATSIAKALDLPFRFNSTLIQPYDVTGYVDGAGIYHPTPFYHAFKDGGIYLADEADAWDANAFLALNAALSIGMMEFPNGEQVKRHPDFICIAAANTWGLGANFDYVGRNKLDASTLDRFITVPFDYDNDLEIAICGNEAWARKVQAWREKAFAKGLKVVISPRASINGAKLITDGFSPEEAAEMTVRKAMTADQWQSIQ